MATTALLGTTAAAAFTGRTGGPLTQTIGYDSSAPTVDYDVNPTPLYLSISQRDWTTAIQICQQQLNNNEASPNQAATWVMRRSNNGGIQWRFLPIHSACALSPPVELLKLLIRLHPSSVQTVDYQSLLPLHYACGSQCSRECIHALLMHWPGGASVSDGNGCVALHYLGRWGPNMKEDYKGIVEMMCVASGEYCVVMDKDGNTPQKLAQNASYPHHNEVSQQIAAFIQKKGYHNPVGHQNNNNGMYHVDTTTPRKAMMDPPPSSSGGGKVFFGRSNMVSFGDLLEDEEREENHRHTAAAADGSSISLGESEVRESIEISLGGNGSRTGGNNVWTKLGISPMNNPNKTKFNQLLSPSSDNRSILSDPLGSTNTRTFTSPRRIDQVTTVQGNNHSEPKTLHRRTFSWDVESSSVDGTLSSTSIIDKYTSPRHGQNNPSTHRRDLLPPTMSSSPRYRLFSDDNTREQQQQVAGGVSSSSTPANNATISRDEYEKLKNAKEITEGQLRMLKLEKEQVDIQRKTDFVENNKRIQADFEERLKKEEAEKKALKEQEEKLTGELEEARKRIAELECQLNEVESFGKNAVETFGKDASKQKEIIAEMEGQMKVLKEKVAANDTLFAQLEDEKKKCAALEAQVDDLKTKIDVMQRTHGEAVYNHLHEVRSLRTSLEKATGDIEKSKSLTVQLNAKEKQHREELAAKEKEWKERYSKLEAHVGSSSSQFGSSSVGPTPDQWKEERSKLEAQIRTLTEANWSAQNAEFAAKSELTKKEAAWSDERAKLEAEIKHLKDIVKDAGGDGYSITSSLLRVNPSFGDNNRDMKMQLDNAMRDADEMRKFNSTIRKEHGQTIADLESELERERVSKKELMSEIVSLQFKVSRLETDLEERGDAGVEVSSYGAKKYRGNGSNSGSGSMDEMEHAKRAIETMRKEADGRERSLRLQLDQANRQIKVLEEDLYKKSGTSSLSGQLDEARNQILQLEKRESNLKRELQEAGAHREEVTHLEAKIRQLEKREQLLKDELDDLVSSKSGGFSSDERKHFQQLRSVKNQLADLQEREDEYLREIRDLKKQITELESNDHGLNAKLWEAQRSQQWAVQEKEDEMNAKIRDVKKEYENTIIDYQNKHLKELRDVKRELTLAFREKEDSYMQQLRDAKRREQALQDREDDLVKQMADVHLKSVHEDLDIDGLLQKKDDEFAQLLDESASEKTAKIAELTSKVESLEQQLQASDDAGLIKKELSECKKELEKQRRQHKSELNKLQNTLEVQKSKEARLQSHIKSMERQISGMVSDYESRLEEAYYATAAVKGALK